MPDPIEMAQKKKDEIEQQYAVEKEVHMFTSASGVCISSRQLISVLVSVVSFKILVLVGLLFIVERYNMAQDDNYLCCIL